MKRIILASMLLTLSLNLRSEEVVYNSVRIVTPTHLGKLFLAVSGDEDEMQPEFGKNAALNRLIAKRANNLCRFMGHGTATGSVISRTNSTYQLHDIDDELTATPNTYYAYYFNPATQKTYYNYYFSEISCRQKDDASVARATKELAELKKILAQKLAIEKQLKEVDARINQSSRNTASVKAESNQIAEQKSAATAKTK